MVEWLHNRNVDVMVEPHVMNEVTLPYIHTWEASVSLSFLLLIYRNDMIYVV